MENKEIDPQPSSEVEESIFSPDEFSLQGYDKHIRQARNAIFAVPILLAINLVILYSNIPVEYEYLWLDFLIWGAFIGGFVFLGFYTKKKPYTAIVAALCLYGVFIALNAYFEISTLYKGLLFKIIIIVVLIKGLNDAKEAQEMKKNFGNND